MGRKSNNQSEIELCLTIVIGIISSIAGLIYWIFRVILNFFKINNNENKNITKKNKTLLPYKTDFDKTVIDYNAPSLDKSVIQNKNIEDNKYVNQNEVVLNEKKIMEDYLIEEINNSPVFKKIISKIENKLNIKFIPKMREEFVENSEIKENKPFVPLSNEKISEIVSMLDVSPITTIIEMQKSGEKGKNYYLDLQGNKCTTEQAFKSYYENLGFKVMRGEVMFWQAIACLAFFEEIYCTNWDVVFNDIPFDLFKNRKSFYNERKEFIENKYEYLKRCDLKHFINSQIADFECFDSRLYYNGDVDCIKYIKSDIAQEFLTKIPNKDFATICYNIVKNAFYNRAGLPDFVIWNELELKFVESKRLKEKIRDSQSDWISFFQQHNIPVEIVRIKGI